MPRTSPGITLCALVCDGGATIFTHPEMINRSYFFFLPEILLRGYLFLYPISETHPEFSLADSSRTAALRLGDICLQRQTPFLLSLPAAKTTKKAALIKIFV